MPPLEIRIPLYTLKVLETDIGPHTLHTKVRAHRETRSIIDHLSTYRTWVVLVLLLQAAGAVFVVSEAIRKDALDTGRLLRASNAY